MITVKLTKREAEVAFDAVCERSQDYVESYDPDTRRMLGGKRFYNLLNSASKKIYKAIKEVA
jgi:hypothetical protein